MSLLVLNIKRELDKGQKSFTDKTIRLLIATIEAYEAQAAELKKTIADLQAETRKAAQ